MRTEQLTGVCNLPRVIHFLNDSTSSDLRAAGTWRLVNRMVGKPAVRKVYVEPRLCCFLYFTITNRIPSFSEVSLHICDMSIIVSATKIVEEVKQANTHKVPSRIPDIF